MNDIEKISNGFDLIAYTLKSEGVEWLACFPNNPLIESCAKFGVRPVVFRQERGGIMAADGYSRLMAEKGKYGVFACQHGPGAENAFGGIAQAWADGVPILFLPEGQSLEKEDIYPNFISTENYKNGGDEAFRSQGGPLEVEDYKTILEEKNMPVLRVKR